MKNNLIWLAFLGVLLAACQEKKATGPLPIIGNRDVLPSGDTIYPQIPDFKFVNQEGDTVTNATFAGKAYVVDFFFIHCPTICPKVKAQMKRVYDQYSAENRLVLLSHSIDTRNDTVPALKKYAEKLGIQTQRWHLVTGKKDDIFGINEHYYSVAKEDPDAPGGFDHSGRLILVDKNRHVRSYCDGTDPKSVDRFMNDIDRLLLEMK